jgi:hypothetical protein
MRLERGRLEQAEGHVDRTAERPVGIMVDLAGVQGRAQQGAQQRRLGNLVDGMEQ